jgi:CsoR family transcriptional regulator, copper-sensing transcriptional repressor
MDHETKARTQARLKRVAGQVAGIQRMIEDDRDCVDVLVQVTAVESALKEAGRVVLAGHFETCLTQAMRSADDAERKKKLQELVNLMSRFCSIDGPAPLREGSK